MTELLSLSFELKNADGLPAYKNTGGSVMEELRQLAAFLKQLTFDYIPDEVKQTAKLCILDTISVAVGAANDKQIADLKAGLLPFIRGEGTSDIWGGRERTSLNTAIFFNAMMNHVLELDDVHTGSKTHVGAVVVPAAWTLARQLGSSGKELILAVICGYEAMARVGAALGTVSHRQKGWHATGTAGTFGAAAACGKLLHLTEDEMVWALGLAGTQSSGRWAFLQDGATCKILHPGRAAANGCDAALLAKSGMTGPEHILTAEDGGILAAMSDRHDVSQVCRGLGTRWAVTEMDTKPYPCCRSTHCIIDAAIEISKEPSFRSDEVESVLVETYEIGRMQCGVSKGSLYPTTVQEAKFSIPYTAAVALLNGGVTLCDFDPKVIQEPKRAKLLRKITIRSDDGFSSAYPQHWGCKMTVYMRQGVKFTHSVPDASGSVYNPLSKDQQYDKAIQLLQSGQYLDAESLARRLMELENLEEIPAV